MRKIVLSTTLVVLISHLSLLAQRSTKLVVKSVLECQVPPAFKGDSIELTKLPVDVITYPYLKAETITKKIVGGTVKWTLTDAEPKDLLSPVFGREFNVLIPIIEPGDSIHILFKNNEPLFSGRNAEKFQLLCKIQKINDSMSMSEVVKKLSFRYGPVTSLKDYLAWHTYLNNKAALMLGLIETKKDHLSPFIYNNFRERVISYVEKTRLWKFNYLRSKVTGNGVNEYGLTNKDLCAIYDTTLNGPNSQFLRYETPPVGDPYYAWFMLKLDAYRESGMFFKQHPADTPILGKDKEDPYIIVYNMVKQKYTGINREELMAFTFWDVKGIIHEAGFTPKVEALLDDYYAQPGYPEYKQVVKEYENERRKKYNRVYAQEFTLLDSMDEAFNSFKRSI